MIQGQLDFRRGFIIAVQAELVPARSGRQGDAQLPFGAGIQVETFLQHPPGHAHAGKSLAGVVNIRSRQLGKSLPHRAHPGGSPGAGIGFIQDVERGAETFRQGAHRAPAHLQVTGKAAYRGGPHPGRRTLGKGRGQLLEISYRGAHRATHIFSGALTPSRCKPLARTWRVASFTQRRVRCRSLTSSSARGVTRALPYQVW